MDVYDEVDRRETDAGKACCALSVVLIKLIAVILLNTQLYT